MYFRLLQDPRSGSMSYLLADLATGDAVLIDPRGGDVPVLHAMLAERGLSLRWTVRTHEHDGHRAADERAALAALGAPLIERTVPDCAVLLFGSEHVEVWATPGHTDHCLSFHWRDRLFCGGLLAVDRCPHQPRPSQPEALWHHVQQSVFTLPDETLLFAGHASDGRACSTVFEQRRWHPWFSRLGRDQFMARVALLPEHSPWTDVAGREPTDDDTRSAVRH